MSATTSPGDLGRTPDGIALRFGRELLRIAPTEPGEPEWGVEWLLKRNCSITPRQLLLFYLSLCAVSLGIATVCWVGGARMVMPFAWLEMLAVGAALLLYARHAGDCEWIALRGSRMTVERTSGSQVQRIELEPRWVRVELQPGEGSLIELSGGGQHVAVGRFVRPELRPQLAEEFRAALRRWAHGAAQPVARSGLKN